MKIIKTANRWRWIWTPCLMQFDALIQIIASKAALKIRTSNYALTVCISFIVCSPVQYRLDSFLFGVSHIVAIGYPYIHSLIALILLASIPVLPRSLSTLRLVLCFFSLYFVSFHWSIFHFALVLTIPWTLNSSHSQRSASFFPCECLQCNTAHVKFSTKSCRYINFHLPLAFVSRAGATVNFLSSVYVENAKYHDNSNFSLGGSQDQISPRDGYAHSKLLSINWSKAALPHFGAQSSPPYPRELFTQEPELCWHWGNTR